MRFDEQDPKVRTRVPMTFPITTLIKMINRKPDKAWLRYVKDRPVIALLMSLGDNLESIAKFAVLVVALVGLAAWRMGAL